MQSSSTRDPIIILASRLILAIIFFTAGFTGMMGYQGPSLFSLNESFVGDIMNSPQFFLVKALEIGIGISLIMNLLIQTALLIAAPILLNVALYHIWVGSFIYGGFALLFLLPMGILFLYYKDTYKVFFKPQMYGNYVGETKPKIVIYDEVERKAPNKVSKFNDLYTEVHEA